MKKVSIPRMDQGLELFPWKDGQGLNQTGGSIAKPSLEQNQPNTPETGSRIGSETGFRSGSGTGSETDSEPVSPSIQARVESVSVDPLTP